MLACVAGAKREREGEKNARGEELKSLSSQSPSRVFLPFPLPPLLTPATQIRDRAPLSNF